MNLGVCISGFVEREAKIIQEQGDTYPMSERHALVIFFLGVYTNDWCLL